MTAMTLVRIQLGLGPYIITALGPLLPSVPLTTTLLNTATPIAEATFDFHNFLFLVLFPLLLLVSFLLFQLLCDNWVLPRYVPITKLILERSDQLLVRQSLRSHETLEFLWSAIPALILFYVGTVSFHLLYLSDELVDPDITVRSVGHQWYWSYEYTHFSPRQGILTYSADSYVLDQDSLDSTDLDRLWATDFSAPLPVQSHIRLLTTSADVIHSWALPSAAVKVDSIPGRLNQTMLFFRRPGRFFGQCSELCGANHGFMPISVCVVDSAAYFDWVSRVFSSPS